MVINPAKDTVNSLKGAQSWNTNITSWDELSSHQAEAVSLNKLWLFYYY